MVGGRKVSYGEAGVEGVAMLQCLSWRQIFYWERLFAFHYVGSFNTKHVTSKKKKVGFD